MARIAGVDLPKNKRVEIGLTYIYGIGRSTSKQILSQLRIDPNTKTDHLSESEVRLWPGFELNAGSEAVARILRPGRRASGSAFSAPSRSRQISVCSAISSASSTSTPRYLSVDSSLVCPSKS